MSSTAPINASSADLVAEVEALGGHLNLVRERIGEIIFGQRGRTAVSTRQFS